MPQALITVNAAPGSDDDVPIDTLVQLNNTNAGGETAYAWAIVDQPPGAVDSLSATNIQNPTFTPKKEGSYLIRLIVNGSALYVDQVVVAVRQVKTNERVPAAGETDEVDASDGWAGATGSSSMLRRLDALLADSNVITAYANNNLTRGQLVSLADAPTIKTGLPGEERLLAVDVVGSAVSGGEVMFVVEGRVDGNVAALLGELVRCRAVGLYGPAALGATSIGEPVYWAADMLSLSPGVVPGGGYRMVGRVVAIDGANNWIWFNGLQFELEPTRLSEQLLDSAAIVSDPGAIRVRSSGGKFQVSEAGAAYVDVVPSGGAAPSNAPYLTDGSVAGLSAERNIQGITSILKFISASNVITPLAVQKFSAASSADIFQCLSELGAAMFAVDVSGNIVLSGGTAQYVLKSGAALRIGTSDANSLVFVTDGVLSWELDSIGNFGALTTQRRIFNVAEPAAQHDALAAQAYGALATTDALAHILAAYTLTDGIAVRVKAGVVCSNATHTKVDVWTVEIAAYRSGGGAVIAGSLITGPTGNLGAGTVTATASGNDVEITVTGDGTALLWKAVGEVITT